MMEGACVGDDDKKNKNATQVRFECLHGFKVTMRCEKRWTASKEWSYCVLRRVGF